ncbi:MAG: pantothenate kinase [SAR86 cluster bacterium]|uniref:Type III pantothenate kinase n=1 Tax=SAR86 cluster bacterium TaxID=2030880 RepID=A0A2A5B505_9GAMM|nr:MAG: pantothenate kinase [SAR86 cluster bacterium]
MILELDIGNSRIKWRQISVPDASLIASGNVTDFAELLTQSELSQIPHMVRVCSVRAGEINSQLETWVRESFDLNIQTAVVSSICGGVSNQYADPSRLGIDRWLAMLAGFRKAGGACVVIDGGTALTIDVISTAGQHQGGYIVPGLALMQSALESNTRISLSQNPLPALESLGNSTDEAVLNGTLVAVLALIERVSLELTSSQGSQIRVFFTGGDAGLLHALSKIDSGEVIDSLVFDGLAIACPYDNAVCEQSVSQTDTLE